MTTVLNHAALGCHGTACMCLHVLSRAINCTNVFYACRLYLHCQFLDFVHVILILLTINEREMKSPG